MIIIQICSVRIYKQKESVNKMEKEKGISMSKFKKICVFWGSSQGKKRSYQDATIDLAKELITGVTVEEVKQVIDMQ
ncbi:hypothetical protein DsansV1_C30g0215461 [Dioscorea sansibarensis]